MLNIPAGSEKRAKHCLERDLRKYFVLTMTLACTCRCEFSLSVTVEQSIAGKINTFLLALHVAEQSLKVVISFQSTSVCYLEQDYGNKTLNGLSRPPLAANKSSINTKIPLAIRKEKFKAQNIFSRELFARVQWYVLEWCITKRDLLVQNLN